MSRKYKDTSPYFTTTIVNNSYLGFWKEREIKFDGTEIQYTIESKYENRPDLLSQKFYRTTELWWVFMVANPDKIHDSLHDLKSGLSITIPNQGAIL